LEGKRGKDKRKKPHVFCGGEKERLNEVWREDRPCLGGPCSKQHVILTARLWRDSEEGLAFEGTTLKKKSAPGGRPGAINPQPGGTFQYEKKVARSLERL